MKIVGIATNNVGKYNVFNNLVKTIAPDLKLVRISSNYVEVDDVENNAKSKALIASRCVDYPVFSTDEELVLDYLDEALQPKARIKRIVSINPSDEEFIIYYTDLLSNLDPSQRSGKISTFIAYAIRGNLVKSSVWKQNCLFRIPPSDVRLSGRPLASFHFYPQYNKFYSELNDAERLFEEESLLRNIVNLIFE